MTAPSAAPDEILARLLSLHPKLIDLGLERTGKMLAQVGNPHLNLPPTIHIAGTNGKGSCLAYLKAIYEASGRKVHAYTSPHLARFNERIYLAGADISDEMLSGILAECEEANGGEPITFFEITTAAAFLAFSRVPADVLLLEVGLGGRFDSTNVITDPAACVIMPVSIDHTQFLGETLTEIAGEKAGILKAGVPAVIAPQPDDAREVIEARATELEVPLALYGEDWRVTESVDRLVFEGTEVSVEFPKPALPGKHQIPNAGAAIATVLAVADQLPVSKQAISAGLTNVKWPARMQELKSGPLVDVLPEGWRLWLDGGHNAAAGAAVAELMATISEDRPRHMILGMLNTKQIDEYMTPFKNVVSSLHTIAIPGEENTLSAEDARDAAKAVGIEAVAAVSVEEAVSELVREGAEPSDIFICGSLYLAGYILRSHA